MAISLSNLEVYDITLYSFFYFVHIFEFNSITISWKAILVSLSLAIPYLSKELERPQYSPVISFTFPSLTKSPNN